MPLIGSPAALADESRGVEEGKAGPILEALMGSIRIRAHGVMRVEERGGSVGVPLGIISGKCGCLGHVREEDSLFFFLNFCILNH